MSSRHAQQSVEILYSRYSDCLRNVEIPSILPHLIEKQLITPLDQEAIMKHTTLVNQRRKLCRALSQHGSGRLVATTTAIEEFKQRLDAKPQAVGNGIVSGHESRGKVISPVDGGNERHRLHIARISPVDGGNERHRLHVARISPVDGGNERHRLHVARHVGESVQNGGSNGHDVAAIANKKLQMKDKSDSPLREEAHCQDQMEAFIVLFFTFIYQILHGIHKRPEGRLPWLDMDTNLEQVREYFPAEAIKGVHPGGSVQLHSSVLLEAFSQFYQKHDRLIQENKSLTSTARLVQAVTKRSTALEEELSQYRGKKMHCRPSTEPRDHSMTIEDLRKQRDQLQSNVRELIKQAEPLRRALAKSEDRNKQLVDVTQQWALECQEKDNQIAVRDSQIRELRAEVDQVKQQLLNLDSRCKELSSDREQSKKKISKLKKQLNSSSEGSRAERVSDSQFEELRVELAYRRELYDQVLIQKEMAEDQVRRLTEQNGALAHQLEENKEIAEELRDRLGNFKVQAQAKEPSVKEMSHLLQENRSLTEENSRLQQQITVLEDQILAFRTHMEELAQAAQHQQQVQRAPQSPRRVDCSQPPSRQPAKTQALVTGYGTAGKRKSSHSNEELHRHHGHTQNGIETSTTGKPQLAAAVVSARSSRPKSAPSHSRSPTPPSIGKLPELREQESSSIATADAGSRSATTDRPLTNGYTKPTGSRDYTREICYPTRSGILVQPLQDDDWEVLQSLNGTSQPQLPTYYDHTPLQPTKSAVEKDPASPPCITPTDSPAAARDDEQFFSFSKNERKCPVCQQIFLALGQSEFRSHIADCFT